jgi:hypothetical protein
MSDETPLLPWLPPTKGRQMVGGAIKRVEKPILPPLTTSNPGQKDENDPN